jgi:hypothetical protein
VADAPAPCAEVIRDLFELADRMIIIRRRLLKSDYLSTAVALTYPAVSPVNKNLAALIAADFASSVNSRLPRTVNRRRTAVTFVLCGPPAFMRDIVLIGVLGHYWKSH